MESVVLSHLADVSESECQARLYFLGKEALRHKAIPSAERARAWLIWKD